MQADTTLYDCRDILNESLQQLEIIESLTKDPTVFINKHFNRNKQHIQWRQNDLIADIKKYSDKLIEENESNRLKCLQISVQSDAIAKEIDVLKEELNKLRGQLDTFDAGVTQLKCDMTNHAAKYLKDRLNQHLEKYRESLLIKNEPLFDFFDRAIEDIVKKVIDKKQVINLG